MRLALINILIILGLHPIHLTVTNIEYNPKTKNLDISIRLFINDFEKILYIQNGVQTNICSENENHNADKLINNYITNHLRIEINNETISSKKFILKKKKKEDITLWLYYSIKYKKSIKSVKIENSLMDDLYKDQKNLLIFTYKNQQKPMKFDVKHTSEKISF